MDESLAFSYVGCEFEPRHCTLFFSILNFINSFIDIIHNHIQTIWVAEYRFNDSK